MDLAETEHTEKALPAGVAAIGGKPEESFQENQCARFYAFTRDALEIEIPALGTVGIARKRKRHASGMESPFAGVAAPRSHPGQRCHEIEHTMAM